MLDKVKFRGRIDDISVREFNCFFKEFEMEMTQTNEHVIRFSSDVSTGSFASSYSNTIQLTFNECDGNGVQQKYAVTMPVEVARELCKELAGDIIQYDENKAKAEAEAEAERLAEATE